MAQGVTSHLPAGSGCVEAALSGQVPPKLISNNPSQSTRTHAFPRKIVVAGQGEHEESSGMRHFPRALCKSLRTAGIVAGFMFAGCSTAPVRDVAYNPFVPSVVTRHAETGRVSVVYRGAITEFSQDR